jgi:hypothetical protein
MDPEFLQTLLDDAVYSYFSENWTWLRRPTRAGGSSRDDPWQLMHHLVPNSIE